MDRSNVPSGERPSSGHARTSSQRSNTPGNSPPFDSNLLNPVVRSKRTPIACTECRRRQVKCSGGTPRCERCEKKSIKCEYIPLHQQRMASAAGGAMSRPQTPSDLYAYQAASSSRSAAGSSVAWRQQQQSLGNLPGYPGAPIQGDWQGQYPSATHDSSVQRYPQQALQSAQPYEGTSYSPPYNVSVAYAQGGEPVGADQLGAQNTGVASHYGYPNSSVYGVYGQPAVSGMSGDHPTYGYRLNPEQQMAAPASQTGPFPAQYYQEGQTMYYQGAPQGNIVSEEAPDWTDPTDAPYAGYHGHTYQ
ncbi:hypothetical protein B0H21DRAFT_22484 [Amylocystis lapponica]|nr:hypothetical protein B0H21DRAFT_22484 [Amylocystis lapponica]